MCEMLDAILMAFGICILVEWVLLYAVRPIFALLSYLLSLCKIRF